MTSSRRRLKPVVAATSRTTRTHERRTEDTMDIQRRVERMEQEMTDLSMKVNGAVHDIASMRTSQDGMIVKIDTMLTAVTTLQATKPPNLLEVASTAFNMVAKAVMIFSAIIGGVIYLIRNDSQPTTEAVLKQSSGYVVVDGKKYPITQQR